jgi:hypothetical protein
MSMQCKASLAWNLGFSPDLCGRVEIDIDDRTLDQIVSDVLPGVDRKTVRINGFEILPENLRKVRLNRASPTPLAVTVHRAPADIGTAIVTGSTAKAGATALTTVQLLTAAAINFVVGLALQLVVNALSPKPATRPEGETGNDQTASLDSNVLDVNNPLPRVFGTHRVFPPLIVHPLTEIIGNDEYVEAVMALAGPHRIDQVYSGDALLWDRASGVSEMPDVAIEVSEGLPTSALTSLVGRQSYTDTTPKQLSAHTLQDGSFTQLQPAAGAAYPRVNASAFGNGVYVVTGSDGTFRSTNGIDFTRVDSVSGNEVIWDGSKFIRVGSSNLAASSPDGLTWTSIPSLSSQFTFFTLAPPAIDTVAFVNGVYLAGGERGRIARSLDGVTWTTITSPFSGTGPLNMPDSTVRGFAASPTRMIAVASNWEIAVSTNNGASWSLTFDMGADIAAVVWNGTRFVAMTFDGFVSESTDGVNWDAPTRWVTGGAGMNAMIFAGGRIIAGGKNGSIGTSTTGLTWVSQPGLASTSWGTAEVSSLLYDGVNYFAYGPRTGDSALPAATSPTGVTWSHSLTSFDASVPEWHTFATREAPDQFWLALNAPSGLYDGDTITQFIRVPIRIQMRQRGATVWENLPEIHWQDRKTTLVRGTIKFIWGAFPPAPVPPAQYGFVFGSPRTQSQAAAPAAAAWSTSAYWGDTGAYTFTTSANVGTLNHVRLMEDSAEFWLDPAVYPKGRYEFRVKKGFAIQASNFVASSYTISGAVKDPFWYQSSPAPSIAESQENRNADVYVIRSSSVWEEHPTPDITDMAVITIRAKNQQMPAIHCTASGYALDWDGTGWNTLTISDNPAVQFRSILNSTIASDPVPPALIDDDTILAWRSHCISRGYKVNAVLQDSSTKTALDVIAGCGYALPIQSERWGISHERDRSAEAVVQVFTPANSRNFQYKKAFERFTDALRVQYRDADENYEPREEIVFAPTSAAPSPRIEQVEYVGLTLLPEVTQRANYDLQQRVSRATVYSLEADIDAMVCRRGDLVVVQSDVLTGQAVAGYLAGKTVAAGLVATLLLDAAVDLGAGPNIVVVRGLDGTIRTASVAEVSTTTSTLTLTSPMVDSVDIDAGALVTAGQGGRGIKRLIVTDIQPGQDFVCTVLMADEAPELLALI